jgi:hypothetical protein
MRVDRSLPIKGGLSNSPGNPVSKSGSQNTMARNDVTTHLMFEGVAEEAMNLHNDRFGVSWQRNLSDFQPIA